MRNLILLAAVVALVGCGLNPSGKTATPSPSPLPEGVINLTALEELEPGRYSFREFGVPIVTFEVDGPWQAGEFLLEGYFDIQQDPDAPDVIAVQFARPTGLHDGNGFKVPTDAADAVALASDIPGIGVVETSSSTIDGIDGSQVTLDNTGDEVVNFMDLPHGAIGINGGRRLWVAFFDTDRGLLAIMVGGSVEKWDEALAAAEPVLESIEIEQ